MIPITTKDRILDVAEKYFADFGFDATSLRMITAAADVNLAAVNYHFQNKESLLDAVIDRRLIPLNKHRLELLDAYRAEAAGDPIPIEKLLDALLRPILEAGPNVPRLIVRFQYLDDNDMFQRVFQNHLKPIFERFASELIRTLPHLLPHEVFLRALFVMGAFSQMMVGGKALQIMTEGKFQSPAPEVALNRLIQFAAAGFQAPALQVTHVSR